MHSIKFCISKGSVLPVFNKSRVCEESNSVLIASDCHRKRTIFSRTTQFYVHLRAITFIRRTFFPTSFRKLEKKTRSDSDKAEELGIEKIVDFDPLGLALRRIRSLYYYDEVILT
jgi:hypothetical protein